MNAHVTFFEKFQNRNRLFYYSKVKTRQFIPIDEHGGEVSTELRSKEKVLKRCAKAN